MTYLPGMALQTRFLRASTTLPRGARIPALRETVHVHVFAREALDVVLSGCPRSVLQKELHEATMVNT